MSRSDEVTGSFADPASQLTLEQARLVDRACDRFEANWQTGRHPDILAAVLELPEPVRPAALKELVHLDAFYRHRAGEVPTAADYATRFPEAGPWDDAFPPSGLGADGNGPERFGDYELMGEIARGGMGVVYKARQVSLNRFVAVKMILAGELARPEDVRRLRAEAEKAAKLNHPNVLPIYEVGERFGRPFFSMMLAPGGSLNQHLPKFANRPEKIAELMAGLAQAVECAHRAGLIHRDLKPANVLLDADDTPYVADFGLAKLAGGEDGLTRLGAIVGTPNYMAPEQARGERELTPAVDIYALGAILYELMTGRPPFLAPTALDTIHEVLEREPVHPCAINPAADRDLSLIALTCLEKDPDQRYQSAAALAADLELRLAGDPPAKVRRRSAPQRFLAWARREPGLAWRLLFLGLSAAIVQINAQFDPTPPPGVLLWVTVIFVVWAVISIACQRYLRRDRFSTVAIVVWVATDVALLTGLLIIDDSHETPVAICYALIVATSGVWRRVRLVWFATAAAVAGYTVVLAEVAIRGGLTQTVHHHVIAVIALTATGVVVAYQVRRARLLSRFRRSPI